MPAFRYGGTSLESSTDLMPSLSFAIFAPPYGGMLNRPYAPYATSLFQDGGSLSWALAPRCRPMVELVWPLMKPFTFAEPSGDSRFTCFSWSFARASSARLLSTDATRDETGAELSDIRVGGGGSRRKSSDDVGTVLPSLLGGGWSVAAIWVVRGARGA